jgi:hypothetical protein
MKCLQSLVCLSIAVACSTARADWLSDFFRESPDVVVNTDVIDHNAPTPTPGKPVYYLAVSAGYRDLGWSMAGQKMPESIDVLRMVTKILEDQGYRIAPSGQTPGIIILYSWGTFYPNPDPNTPKTYVAEIMKFLGSYKANAAYGPPNIFHPEIADLAALVPQGIYIMTFSAFDFASAQKGVARLLWKTNVSNSTRGFYLPEILPTMLTVAAPLIGKETKHPVWINPGKHYQPRIEIGPLKVIEMGIKLQTDKKSPQ